MSGEGRDLPIRDHVYVDAVTGQELTRYSDIHTAMNRAVYSANNGSSLPGTLNHIDRLNIGPIPTNRLN